MERTRVRNPSQQVQKTVWCHSQHFYNGSITTDWWPSSTGWHGTDSFENTTDVVTEDFYRKRAAGVVINNPYYNAKLENRQPPVTTFVMKETNPSNVNDYWLQQGSLKVPSSEGMSKLEDFHVANPDFGALRDSVQNLAVTSAHANIDESAMLALATAAESKKSVASMAAISRKVYSIFKQVKRLDIKGLKNEISPKELSQRYMELRYALRPLVYDAVGVMKGLDKERRIIRQTYRGFAEDKMSWQGSPVRVATGINKLHCDKTNKWHYTVSARAGVLCDVSISNVEVWGADKVVESLWELAPWSFVADWFFNIGDTIAALTPNAGVKQRASWVVVKEILTQTSTFDNAVVVGSSWTPTASMQPVDHVQVEVVKTRIVEPSVSVFPEVNFRLDGYKLTDLGIMLQRVFS